VNPVHEREAWLSLGSNLGDRAAHLTAAIEAVRALPGTAVEAVSGLYETPPWGDTDQGPFLNAAIGIRTALEPLALLDAVKAVEADLGRRETRRWGPRVIDIDIVHMAGVALATQRLTLPHPLWRERAFVLVPLAEIAPELVIGQLAVTAALERLDASEIRRVPS